MKFYVGVTDNDWFDFLADRQPDEVNFWRPKGPPSFRVIPPGALFLFKLHSPLNFVVGGGFLVRYTQLPLSLAWKCFGKKNGCDSEEHLRGMIQHCRRDQVHNPEIGCTVLTQPFFFPREQWIPQPSNWAPNIVSGRGYETTDVIGRHLWEQVQERLKGIVAAPVEDSVLDQGPQYGQEYLTRARLGQGAFRVLVTDAYHRRCAMTGEKILPVLEAAHIKRYADGGPHQVQNGLLLKADLHILFDAGYVTVTDNHRIEVSRRLHDEFDNGREYYKLHGKELQIIPDDQQDKPAIKFLQWHQDNCYVG